MEFELPGQFKGPECRRVMPQAIKLRKMLCPWFENLEHDGIDKLSIILRVDGSLGTFGPPGVENIVLSDALLCCDLVIADHDWENLSDEGILEVLRRQVSMALTTCLDTHVGKYDTLGLNQVLSGAANKSRDTQAGPRAE